MIIYLLLEAIQVAIGHPTRVSVAEITTLTLSTFLIEGQVWITVVATDLAPWDILSVAYKNSHIGAIYSLSVLIIKSECSTSGALRYKTRHSFVINFKTGNT